MYLKGVGPQRAELLKKELGIETFTDLLHHFPFRYEDRSQFQTIAQIRQWEGSIQLKGRVDAYHLTGQRRTKKLSARFTDATGSIELVWFKGQSYIPTSFPPMRTYVLYGKATQYGGIWNIAHPELSLWEEGDQSGGWQSVYSSTEKLTDKGLHSKGLSKLMFHLLDQLKGKIADPLPHFFRKQYRLMDLETAFREIHFPSSEEQGRRATFRLKFEELYYLQLELLQRKQHLFEKMRGFTFPKLEQYFPQFYNQYLPFQLTEAQKRVLKEIRKDVRDGKHMNRLLQGDVGSGKTIVALLTMLMALDNGFQAALMAPTEILAQQHHAALSELLAPMQVEVALLTGSVSAAKRKELHAGLETGTISLLVGTHALLEKKVQFNNLGLVVIDEQHRFGVAQRAQMWKKNSLPPHVLVMTATPIPRTLAMTFYGDLDVSVLDELPPGRKPISTLHKFESSRTNVFELMRKEIAAGRQVYVVYPLIEENPKLELNSLMEGYEAISRAFPLPEFAISIVHGKMKPEAKDYEMQRFAKGETHILVATTVIEVGVNVTNASVMVIENAERFGLSQLHQLRGRVGRGADKSYCVLMTGNKLTKEAKKRMSTMVKTQDGFEIAEVDLALRGPGDLMGTQQSGELPLRLANLAKDGPIVSLAREAAQSTLQDSGFYQKEEWVLVRKELAKKIKSRPNWGRIS